MNKRNQVWWIVGGVVALIGLVVLLILRNDTHNWEETYAENEKEEMKDPYGVYVLLELMNDYFPNEKFIIMEDSLSELSTAEVPSSCVFFGQYPFPSGKENDVLLEFVAKGNTAFFAADDLSDDLLYLIDTSHCVKDSTRYAIYSNYIQDTLAYVNFTHPMLNRTTDFAFQHRLPKGVIANYNWTYLELNNLCEEESAAFEVLGYLNDELPYFIRFQYGEGYIYWHSIPTSFTNINLIEEEGKDYASRALSHLPEGTIYWDVYSKTNDDYYDDYPNDDYHGNRNLSADHPLRYVLSQPPLAWAWYLTLLLGLLFLIFRAKRRQRIIPVLEQKKNTSLDFVRTIGHLYFLQNNHRQLALQQMQLWLTELRERYHLPLQTLDEESMEALSKKSDIPLVTIRKIVNEHGHIEAAKSISAERLMAFHHLFNDFKEQQNTNQHAARS